ncbi:MAG: TIGR00282 family metallophosphoesterase [Candidatus Gracilibacteria bacterium]|nr:TIGR00282 family metallophosphoesterase [Candidatus Gracilibacteria bacterium]MDD4530638.1 TIGR00282 family metallophosphoesterase [Candidatus Gracilibacteria bacterium]
MIKFLIFGDIFGRNGRRLLNKFLPGLKEKYDPDFIVGNSENLSSGKGPTLKHIKELEEIGFDCLTGGDHIFTNIKDIHNYLNNKNGIQIRPLNYFESKHFTAPGKGYKILEKNGKKILIVNLISGNLKDLVDNPFLRVEKLLEELKEKFDAIIIDFHKEFTSEGYMLSLFLDGKVGLVYGTHTHIQTNDEHVLPSGTGMISDVGMIGAYNSSIGQSYDSRIIGFLSGLQLFAKPEQDMGPGVLFGIYVEITKNKCVKIEKIRIEE